MSLENPLENLGLERIRMEEDDRYSWVYYAGKVESIINKMQQRIAELEKENSNLKRDNEQSLLRADNWKSLCFVGEENIAELEKKFQEAESCSHMIPINRWKKCSEELPKEDEEILFVDEDGCYYVGTMWRVQHPIDGEKEIYWQGKCEPICENPAYWMPLPKAPEEAK